MGDEGPRVGHCIGGEELTLGQGRRGEGLILSRGGMVTAKFEAHIIRGDITNIDGQNEN